MKKAIIFIVLALLLTVSATPVYANGIPLPHAFYGSVTINGVPASPSTLVEASGEGVLTGIEDNPTITSVAGIYGTSNPFEHRLIVQGDIAEGTIITFYVNGYSTGQTAEWHSGETTELDLSVTISAPGGGGGGSPPPPTSPKHFIYTNLFGSVYNYPISQTGEILETIVATSADGNLNITIPAGTVALDKDGNLLSILTAQVDPSPPPPPEGANIIGLAYNFRPPGATFNPPITIEFTYDPADIPEGVAEEDLVLAFYDEEAGKWIELPCTVDPVTHTITASVSHFTTFAILAYTTPVTLSVSSLSIHPAEVQPKEVVTITVSVANTGSGEGGYSVVLEINGVKEAEKSVTVAAGSSQSASFSVSKGDAGTYRVVVDGLSGSFTVAAPPPPVPPTPSPPAKPAINWPVLYGVIAVVVILGLLILFLARRRTYRQQ